MPNVGTTEIILLLLLALLLFGAKRIPEIGRSIGRGIQEFKKGMRDLDSEINSPDKSEPPKAPKLDEPRKP